MAATALIGLGESAETVAAWLEHYQTRLSPLADAPADYRQYLADMLMAVRKSGARALLHEELPALISGWARDAYHPLIRTAYGLEFGLDEEVAAGLACLKRCGPDERIEHLAETASTGGDIDSAFSRMSACATNVTRERNFNACLDAVIAQPGFRSAALTVPDQLTGFSRRALDVFAATHDFFALHLVTGAHAYRLLYPYAGKLKEPIFALGLLAGYASVGAPSFSATETAATVSAEELRSLISREGSDLDEHDIKLAHSALSQGRFFSDPAFTGIAAEYFRRR